MATIRTVVTFESPAFNATEPRDSFINDGCYGDDVARALIERLRARGIRTDTEPGPEDFGWHFGFHVDGTDYHFSLGFRPADGGFPAVWIGELERRVGWAGSLFGAGRRSIGPEGVANLHSAISTLPQVGGVRWHRKEDFDALREELGQSDPGV